MKQEEIVQRRERVVRKTVIKEELGQGLQEAEAILNAYLKERGMNQTPERSQILWTIYHLDAPFDVDMLLELVRETINICRGTIHNSLEIFADAGVIARFLPFANGSQFFVKSIGQPPRAYQVCSQCGAIKVLSTKEIVPLIAAQTQKSFHTSQYCLYVLGLCANCFREKRHEVKLHQQAAQQEREKRTSATKQRRRKKRYTSIKEVRLDQELQALREKKFPKNKTTK